MTDLIIKDFDKLSDETKLWIQEEIAGNLEVQGNYIIVDPKESLKNWIENVKQREDIEPTHIDIERVFELCETGNIKNYKISVER